jgi:predicted AlkP superfamily pyrophosphatase or phosphodiesterase
MIRVLSSLVAIFSITTLYAQSPTGEVPKLVVAITIDQLRGDYLEMFKHTFGQKGFNRLLSGGLVYNNLNYNFPKPDKASSITTIYTGANPSYHGITAENKYVISLNREESSFFDNNYLGNFTSDKRSPLPIKVSTITDELKIASGGLSEVYAFAPDASQALASGGHAASGAFWIEDATGKWATTTFYKNKQPIVDQQNRSDQSLTNTIGSLTWRPANDIAHYKAFPYTQNRYNFQHRFNTDKADYIRLFKQSPFVNKEVTDMAIMMLETGGLGKRTNPDFLALTFYAGNFEKALDQNYSLEIQDTYWRLDRELERLLDVIEATVGIRNTLIFVVSTGYFKEQEVIPDGIVTTGGDFYPDRSQALLNMYLMALYGREQWVKTYYNNQIFFDSKLLEDLKIDMAEFQQKAAEFLVQSAGVQDVITTHQMLHGAYNENIQFYRNGYYKGISGDLFLEIQPGWRIIDWQNPDYRVRENAVMSPVIFFGSDIKPQRIDRTIDATEVVPSVAYRLRIRAPNAAKGKILPELF